jgi:hypothetical protein
MLVTLITVLLAAALATYTQLQHLQIDGAPLAILIGTGGALILFLTVLFNTYALGVLERLEQKLIPNLMLLYRQDSALAISRLLLFIFPVISFLWVALILIPEVPHKTWFFLVWLVCFGIAIDLLRDSWHRLTNFLSPSFLVKTLEKDAKRAVKQGKDDDFLDGIDALSEVSLRAMDKSKIALSNQALQAFPPVLETYYEVTKSIVSPLSDDAKKSGPDEVSYTMFYLLSHLELINDRALKYRLEIICRNLIRALGKIIIYSAKFDVSLVSFPTHFLSKFGLKSQQHHFDEVAILTTSTLVEIAKTIINEIDITYMELQDAFRAIINGLDALAKAAFKKNKDTSISVLIEPFQQLQALFQTEKMANHPDTPVILNEINRVLQEWDTLDRMMKSLPVIPDLPDDALIPPMPPGA